MSYSSCIDNRNNINYRYYENGEIREKIVQLEDEKQIVSFFTKEGVLSEKSTYLIGERNGVSTTYFNNGDINEIAHYKNDKMNGNLFVYKKMVRFI